LLWLDWYDFFGGSIWLVKYQNRYFLIQFDGTENEKYHTQEAKELSEEEVIRCIYLKKTEKLNEMKKLFDMKEEDIKKVVENIG